MPNLLYIRPCDMEEVVGTFIAAINATTTPSLISLSRQNLPQYTQYSSREGVQKGAYVFAVQAKAVLEKEHNIKARIVSFPCQRLFEQQTKEYKQSVLQYSKGKPIVVVEVYAVNGWERYADAGISMSSFGKSLPSAAAYEFFGFNAEVIAKKVKGLVEEVRRTGIESLSPCKLHYRHP